MVLFLRYNILGGMTVFKKIKSIFKKEEAKGEKELIEELKEEVEELKEEIEELKEEIQESILQEKEEAEEEPAKVIVQEKRSFFTSLKEKLVKSVSKEGLFGKIKNFFSGRTIIDEEMYEDLEDLLIQSDIGMDMTLKIVENLEKEVRARGVKDPQEVYEVLKDVMKDFLVKEENMLDTNKPGLNVVLIVGVNGVGKTTTIGKIAAKLIREGKQVVIGAADTFRAAAIEQLEEWANRSGADIIKHSQGSDPGAVVFDTLKAAEKRGADVAIIDTAGRLHNKGNLMKELEKINKIIKSHVGETAYESLLVIDGTTGQNGLTQAKVFNEVTDLTGFVVTKLDGTAKGGIIFSISEELRKPIKFIGVGEGIEDLREFNAEEYINAIFE
jgi:fused signal recognition particle receptor